MNRLARNPCSRLLRPPHLVSLPYEYRDAEYEYEEMP
jgi:hypothetical protein